MSLAKNIIQSGLKIFGIGSGLIIIVLLLTIGTVM